MDFRLKRGYNIRVLGEAKPEIEQAAYPGRVALKPNDFIGLKARIAVDVGDRVRIGTPLFHERNDEKIVFTSPASGRVIEIRRGEKRVIQGIVVETDGKRTRDKLGLTRGKLSSTSRDSIIEILLKTGLFPCIRQRPFAKIANPADEPRDIFISAMDTGPLSADPNLIVRGNEDYFQRGLDVMSHLTRGRIHLSVNGNRGDNSPAFVNAKGAEFHRFTGPHPAGTVGVQIHHIAPVRGARDIVWYSSVQSVILIGKLFTTGELSPEITLAVAGSSATKRSYFQSVIGASADSIVGRNMEDGPVRYISGNLLTGTNIGSDGFLGFYDNLITLIPEAENSEFLGWIRPGLRQESRSWSYLSRLFPAGRFMIDTNRNGSERPFVATGLYERVLPMDILPLHLLKSILAEDVEEMEGLGIYEVAEEDFALCEYICPSKVSVQEIIRRGLDLMEREG
jgi:Na+-transporting NADH:ubiquinone oxidoreductase subunit A